MAIVRAFSTGRTVAGRVLRRKDGLAAAPYEVRVLDEDDHPRLRALHHEVVAAVPEGMVARESDEFLARNLGPGGSTFGVLVGDELVGYAILSFPRGDDDNLAAPWAPDPRRCACLDGAGVLPAWRGNRLQRLLTGLRLDLARRLGRAHVTALAAPVNRYSWRNLMAGGLAVHDLLPKYGGHWRYVLYRNFDRPPPRLAGPAEIVPIADLERQRGLLRRGWIGVEGRVQDGVVWMLYGRPVAGPRAVPS
jgi:hypothetical protein